MRAISKKWLWLLLLVFSTSVCQVCRGKGEHDFDNSTLQDHVTSNVSHAKSHGIHVASWNYDYVGKPLLVTLFIVAVCAIKILFKHAHRIESLIPESCLLIILGIVIGLLFLLEGAHTELEFLHFKPQTFFLYLLPPIILEAAYSLKDRAFVENLGAIILYAVVGTILNVCLVGPALYVFYRAGFMGSLKTNALECMIFSAIVAAVDPVAVLAIFEEIGVNKMLYFMVFGESLFNDAVTIVLYNMILSFMQIDHVGFREIGLGLAAFLCVSLGGMAIGFVYGFLTAFGTKYTSKIRMAEPVLFFGLAYLAYISAELFHFSGIIGIICCGLVQSHYAADNISSKSYVTVYYFSKVMSGVAESLIFIILGAMLVTQSKAWLDFNVRFALLSLLMCLLARFAVVFGLAYFLNKVVVTVRKIRKQEQFIMAYGGLRGAVTFSLVFMLDPESLDDRDKGRNVLLTSAYLIIFFTTFLQGISIKPLVKKMRIRLETKDTNMYKEINQALIENSMAGLEEIIGHRGSYYWAAMTKHLSNRFLRPAVQKFPHRKYSSFVAAFQEASMLDKYSATMTQELSVRHMAALWSELDEIDKEQHCHGTTVLEMEHQDEYEHGVRKEQAAEMRKAKAPKLLPPPLPLQSPRDMLSFKDMLRTPPHKTMHYVFDLDAAEDRKPGILNHIRHLGRVRRRHHSNVEDGPGKTHAIGHLLQGALIPLSLVASSEQQQSWHDQRKQATTEVTETEAATSNNDQEPRPRTPLSAPVKSVTFTLDDIDHIDDEEERNSLLSKRFSPRYKE